MGQDIFKDVKKEFWFHVSNQDEIIIQDNIHKSIDCQQVFKISKLFSKANDKVDYIKNLIKTNIDIIDILRTLVGVTDKRMYLELSYIFNKLTPNKDSDLNILEESKYILRKHDINFFKNIIKNREDNYEIVLEKITHYLEDKGIINVLLSLSRLSKKQIINIIDFLILPKEIQQAETKRRGHEAEKQLAKLFNLLNIPFIPDKRHVDPMSQRDPNISKHTFKIKPRKKSKTWSMDLIIKKESELKIFIQSLIHTSDPGQYGVNKSDETEEIKKKLKEYNKTFNDNKELWGLVDGVGFIENPDNTIFKMLAQFDNFIQLKSLYKAALGLHKFGLTKIKAIRYDMDFYTEEEAMSMHKKYGANVLRIKNTTELTGDYVEIEAGKAWVYL